MKLALPILLALTFVLAPAASAGELRCEGCGFTIQVPEGLSTTLSKGTIAVEGEGFRLDATWEEGDFEARIERLSNPIRWWRDLKPQKIEFQTREPERGTYRGVDFASLAGTAVLRRRNQRLWISWMAFDNPGPGFTTLVYRIEGNPSSPKLLDLYDGITASLRFDEPPRPSKPPEPSDATDAATTPKPRSRAE